MSCQTNKATIAKTTIERNNNDKRRITNCVWDRIYHAQPLRALRREKRNAKSCSPAPVTAMPNVNGKKKYLKKDYKPMPKTNKGDSTK